ncbi:SDR family NAD(P)-dependent oxidoreductase [Maricaulis salignorans]|uniref:SDR family NAD(P)-dependent oxidoreductase n=1 Tax=Maricaulis salignorans TaxID=144026 RepID=UPI003A8F4A57
MTHDLNGRTAIITGAGQGLGRSYALALSRAGANIVVNDIGRGPDGRPTAEAVCAEIQAAGGKAVANTDSVSERDGAQAMVRDAIEHFGSIDILVSNAGIERNKSYGKSTDEEWEAVTSVHLTGTHYLCHAAWPHMLEQQRGRIILVSSPSGLWGNFAQSSYAAAKMGIIGLGTVLAIEGQRKNILVNSLAPIATTPMTEALLSPELAAKLSPDEVAPAVTKLASDALTTTGAIIVAGGGWFSSAHISLSPGVHFEGRPGPADLDARWEEIVSGDKSAPSGPLDPDTLQKMFVGD